MLSTRDIELQLLYGTGTPEEEKKKDSADIPWATKIPTRYYFNSRLCWQPIHLHLCRADMVVVTQENALLANHLLILRPRRFKLAFWGHGANLQSTSPKGYKERFKRWTTKRVDWWFAYTQVSAYLVIAAGFPETRVTVLNNAVDTSDLRRQRESITTNETMELRRRLGFGPGPVGVFVGSLYAEKRLDFLFAAAEKIRLQIPDFQLLMIGDGPEQHKVRTWCDEHHWTQWVGTGFGQEKALYLSLATVMLNPGLVGLGILDAFACDVPIVTTNCGIHSPEIAYLENGHNGVMTANSLRDYASTVVQLLYDSEALNALRAGCEQSAVKYTLENMARRFTDGVSSALKVN